MYKIKCFSNGVRIEKSGYVLIDYFLNNAFLVRAKNNKLQKDLVNHLVLISELNEI